MDSTLVKNVLVQALQFIVIIMLISFVLDTGFEKLTKESLLTNLENWFKSILTLNKLGIWVVISLGYSYFRITRLRK
ncbi:hypothetical protein MCERE19_01872 [Spirosomataceae bacterium]|jgi:hypothetical protein